MSAAVTSVKTSSSKMTDNSKKNIVEIYTDWANHYLDKTKVSLIFIFSSTSLEPLNLIRNAENNFKLCKLLIY